MVIISLKFQNFFPSDFIMFPFQNIEKSNDGNLNILGNFQKTTTYPIMLKSQSLENTTILSCDAKNMPYVYCKKTGMWFGCITQG